MLYVFKCFVNACPKDREATVSCKLVLVISDSASI